MKKISVLLLSLFLTVATTLRADEGMWMLPLLQKLNIGEMQKMGCKLSADDIYSINNSSLKDAIVIFGGGCTGELISDKGLILTNHHCGYSSIQQHSTVEHDYLTDGFWAKSLNEELPTPGLKVTFLSRVEDVTERVNATLNDKMTEPERYEAIRKISQEIEKEAKEGTHYKTQVRSFFANNDFYLFVYEVFTDVRMVGAPPSSIGKFGADTDNWMWPRHTGDFSLFRVYAGPDGKPADYSPENKPLKPRHHLPISLKGVEMNDFAMTMGYPGSTDRYLTSWGIKERMNIINAARIEVRGQRQEILLGDMQSSDKVRIQYSSKYSRSSNYWKNSIGMNKGLTRLKVLDKKQALEKEFAAWVATDAQKKGKYGDVLPSLEKAYAQQAPTMKALYYMNESLIRGSEIIYLARKAQSLEDLLAQKGTSAEDINKATKSLEEAAEGFYKDYNAPTDEKVVAAMLKVYKETIAPSYHPDLYKTIQKKYKGDFEKYSRDLFNKTFFKDSISFKAFLAKPSLKKLQKDPAFQAAKLISKTFKEIYSEVQTTSQEIARGNRLFIAGLREMDSSKAKYPDANFTMRLSYGKVGDYIARDAVHYSHFTTLKGVMEKEDPNNWEFVVSAKLKELYQAEDYGQYADKDGSLHVCFTSNNDITGGNSGSPVINAEGHLFGLAFDGNWEAMSGDIAFETELQKCINVDIRYVLFIIDKFAGATNLIDEMTLIK